MLAPKSGQLQKKKKKKGDAAFQLQPPAGSVNFATGKVVGPAVSSTQSQSEAAASAAELKAALRIGLEQAALQASVAAASPSRVNSSTTKTSRMKDISDSSYRSQQVTRSTCAETSMLSATLLTEASGEHFPGHSHSRGSAGFAPPEDTSYVECVRGPEPPPSKRPERPPPGLDDKRTSTSAPAAEIVAAGGAAAAPEVAAADSPSAAGSAFVSRPQATRRRQRLAKTSFQRGFHEGAHAQAVAAHEIAAGYALKMHEARLRDAACKDSAALREGTEPCRAAASLHAALQEQFDSYYHTPGPLPIESGLPLNGGELSCSYPYDGTPYGLRGPRRELNAANQKGGGYPLSADHAFNSQHLPHFPEAASGTSNLGYTDFLGGVAQGGAGSAPQHGLVAVYDYDRHHYPRPSVADAVNYGADHHGLSLAHQYSLAHQLAQSSGYTGKMMKMGRPLNKNTAGGKGKHGFGGKQLGMSYSPGTSTTAAAWSSKGGGGKQTGPLTKGTRAPQLSSSHTGTSSSAASSSSTSASVAHKKSAPNANKLLVPGPPAGAGRAKGEAHGQLHQDAREVQLDESDRVFKNRVTDERHLKRALDQKQLRAHLHKTSKSAETAPSPPPEEFAGGPGRGSSPTPSDIGVELREDLQDSGTSTGGFEEDQHRLGDSVARISSGGAGRTALNHQRLQQMLMREPEKLNYTSYNCPTKLPGYLSMAMARRMNVEHQDTALTFVTPNKTGPAAAAAAALLGSVGNGGSHTPSGKGSASPRPGDETACHPKTVLGAIQGGSEAGDYRLSSAGQAACSGAASPPPPAPHHVSLDRQHDGSIAMATTSTTCMLDLEAKSCRVPTQSLLAKQLQRSVESLRFESNGETTTRRGRPLLEDSPGHSTTTPSSNQFFSLSPVAGAVSPPEVGDHEDHGHEDAKDENGKQGSGIGNGITGRKCGRPGASRVAAVRLFGTSGPTLELPQPAEEAASSSRASDQLSAARNHNPGLFRHKAKQTRAGRLEGMKLKLGLSSADGASEDPLTERQPEHELASPCTNDARAGGPHGPACFVPLYDAIVSGVGGRSCAEDPLAAVGTEFAALLQKEAALQEERGGCSSVGENEIGKKKKQKEHCIKGDADLEFRAQGLSSNWLRAVYDDVSKALCKMNRPDAYMRFYGSTVNGFSGLSCAGVFSPLSQGNKGEQHQNSAGDVDVSIMVPELRADEERTFFHLLKHNLLTLGENTEDLDYGTTPNVATTTGDQQHQEHQPPPGRDSIASRPSTGSGRIVQHGLSYEWCFNELLMFTKVKVLRMTLFEGSRAQEVDVELTLNNHAGVQNSGILYQLSQLELCPAGNFHRLLDFPSDHPVGVVTMDSVWQEGDSFDDRFVGSVRTNEAAGFRNLQLDFEKFRLPDDVTSQHSLSQGSGGGCSISRTASTTQQQETSFPDVEGDEVHPEETTAPTPTRVILQRSFSACQNSSRSPFTFGALGATVKELVRGVGGIPSKDVFEHHKAISSYRLLLLLIVYLQKEGVFQKDKNFQEGFFAPKLLLSSRGGEEKAIRKELLQKAVGEMNSGAKASNNDEGGSAAHKQPVLRSLAFLHKAQAEQLFRREMERQMQKYAVGGSGGCGTRRLGHTTYVSTAGHDVHPTDQAPAATRVTAAMAMRVSRPAYLFQYLLRGFFQYYLSAFRQSRAAVFSTADPWAYNPELVYRQHEVLFFTKRFEAIVEALGEA